MEALRLYKEIFFQTNSVFLKLFKLICNIYDCFECGIIMVTKGEFETHIETIHTIKRNNDEVDINKSDDNNVDTTSEFDIDTYKDNKGEEHGITIKSKTKEFKESKESIKQMLVKGSIYNVGGRQIEVLNVLSNRPGSTTSVVQVKQGGKAGKVELVLWNQSEGKQRHKKSTTIEIKRMPKEGGEFPHVERVKEIIIWLLNRFYHDENVKSVIAEMKKNPNEKTVRPKGANSDKTIKCPTCGDMFEKQVGLSIHTGIKHPEIKKVIKNVKSATEIIEIKEVKCKAERCQFSCRESELKLHEEDMHTIRKNEYVCDTCSRWWQTKHDLELHDKNHHKHSRKNGFKPVETPKRKSDAATEDDEEVEEVTRKCEDCDLIIKGESLMSVLQQTRKHKTACTCRIEVNQYPSGYKCEDCDETFSSSDILRKHIKDDDNIGTFSMSPKSKKKKENKIKESVENMDI